MADRRWLAGALALCLLLSGCGAGSAAEAEAPAESAPVETSSAAEVENTPFTLPYYPSAELHPMTGNNRTNLVVTSLMYETMFVLGQSFTPSPGVCSLSSISEDGLQWTLAVEAGHTFSDGTPVTADDVAASLNLARQTGSLYAARLSSIQSVRAQDGRVLITLSAPNGALDALLDIPVLREADGLLLGSGPYVLSQSEEEARLFLNPYWPEPDRLPFDEIELSPISETDDLIYSFDSRAISLVHTDLTGTNALGFSGDFDVWDYPTTTMQYLAFNTKRGFGQAAALRLALSRTIDRASVTTALLSRHADAAALPVSPRSPLYDSGLAVEFSYDVQSAQAQLEAAGYNLNDGLLYSGRNQVALRLIVNADSSFKTAIADYVAECFSKAGVETTVEALSWDAYNTALASGDFDLYLAEVKLTADFDLTALLSAAGALNYGGYSSGDTDALLTAFRTARGEGRTAAARQLYRQLCSEAPLVPLCFKTNSVLTHWGQLEGVTPTQQNLFYSLTDWSYTSSAQKTEE